MVLFYSKVKVDWRRLAEDSLLNLDVTFGPGGYVKSQDLDPKYFQGTEMVGVWAGKCVHLCSESRPL